MCFSQQYTFSIDERVIFFTLEFNLRIKNSLTFWPETVLQYIIMFQSFLCGLTSVSLYDDHFSLRTTGRFIMFSVITNIYNEKTKGPTLMELFTATGKLKKFFFHN
jgi:hypothetical protein